MSSLRPSLIGLTTGSDFEHFSHQFSSHITFHTTESLLFLEKPRNSAHSGFNRHFILAIVSKGSMLVFLNNNNNNNNDRKISLFNFRMSSHILVLTIFLINTNDFSCCQALQKVWFITSCSDYFTISALQCVNYTTSCICTIFLTWAFRGQIGSCNFTFWFFFLYLKGYLYTCIYSHTHIHN